MTTSETRAARRAEVIARSRGDAYWYHLAIVAEVDRLASIGELPYTVAGIAGNVRQHSGDCARYVRELVNWGVLAYDEKGRPDWDYSGDWVTLA